MGAVGPGGDGPLEPLKEEEPIDSPTVLPEGDRPSGPSNGDGPTEPAPTTGASDSSKGEKPARSLEDEQLDEVQIGDGQVRTPDGEEDNPPPRPEALEQGA